MKKIIKPLIVIVIIVGLVAGGLYAGYRYRLGKKTATVVSVLSYGMDGYWGDSIESYGTVTSEKSQTTYLTSGTEILSVNFAEGDHVNEGDVLLTVKKESQNIKGKELEVQKALQTYTAYANKLDRLQNTTPIPEYISSSEDTRTRTQIVYNPDTGEDEEISYEEAVGKFYYDAETGNIIGYESYTGGTNYPPPQGYKPSELKEAIETTTDDLIKADLDLRIKQNQLEQMKNTNENGEIIAKVSGTVSKVQNSENYNSSQPFMIVSATDEYFISGTIGEFYLDSVHVGDSVSVMSWDNGVTAEAIITDISDSPSTDDNGNYWSSGNSNVSNYQFKASFDRSSGIEIGSGVEITITPEGQETSGLYINNFFIRKDAGGSYVMKMNGSNKLEKVYVNLGRTLWGEMIEIKNGVTVNDYLAFPYGDGAIEGLTCNVADSLD